MTRRSWTLLIAGGTALVVGAALVAVAVPGRELVAGTASAAAFEPSTPAPIPADPKHERWRWDEEPIEYSVAAGLGLVARTGDGVLLGIDGRTGRRLWQRETGEERMPGVDVFHATPDRAVVVGWTVGTDGDTGLRAFNAFSGQELWRAYESFIDVIVAAPAVIRLVADGAGPLRANDIATGKELWTYDPPPGCPLTTSGSAIAGEENTVFAHVVCTDGGVTTHVVALDAASGTELWRRQLSTGSAQWRAVQPLAGGAVALTIGLRDLGATVVAVDQRTGRDLTAAGPDVGYVEEVAEDGLGVLTGEGLYRIGSPEPDWRFPDSLGYRSGAVRFGQLVARIDRGCGRGATVALYEIGTGALRRSLGCFDLPTVEIRHWITAAPGALVVHTDGQLIGYA